MRVASVILLQNLYHVIDGSLNNLTAVTSEPPGRALQEGLRSVVERQSSVSMLAGGVFESFQSSRGSPGKRRPPAVSISQLSGDAIFHVTPCVNEKEKPQECSVFVRKYPWMQPNILKHTNECSLADV